jgi:lipid-A-disaccharide synthase-like uncharacterized protein
VSMPLYEKIWMGVGFAGQAVFTARFLVQWAVSEKKRDSVVPVAFWWISLFGGLTLLSYAIHRKDPPIILGQAMGLVVYVRNLMLVSKSKRRAAKRLRRTHAQAEAATVPRQHRVDAGGRVLDRRGRGRKPGSGSRSPERASPVASAPGVPRTTRGADAPRSPSIPGFLTEHP